MNHVFQTRTEPNQNHFEPNPSFFLQKSNGNKKIYSAHPYFGRASCCSTRYKIPSNTCSSPGPQMLTDNINRGRLFMLDCVSFVWFIIYTVTAECHNITLSDLQPPQPVTDEQH